ncbi:GT4 family glycosyltransferase PelF [Trichlorobacter lovleyi]|uniref:Glycosyl transferase group 1 n=1 Tax=Trichlorobacter lovleyi (strain ATCC BAA-1151 / DSM 17278 / SZ) TaxID=398767 RepID=B3EAM4_TRIL1|nr:GT4 family glycosyltransferase PelF [Trichlorobacter lovleyi]ACD96907.1 glycosyl transferase group 1 [Trichlorobacter lovleyi SZ]
MADNRLPRVEKVDVMLLLEGTFPYVSGGVSSWVNQIIRGFPELDFGAVFIGSRADEYDGIKYELPANLKHLQVHYLHDEHTIPPITPCSGDAQGFETLKRLHGWFANPHPDGLPAELKQASFYLNAKGGVDYSQFLYARRSWEYICELYSAQCTDPSFVDYFWSVRNMHAPIWQLAAIAGSLIPARVYHTVSTGYAGFLGGLLHHHTGRPLLLSEHGIYTKERRIDIFNNEWIQDNRNALQRDPTEISYFRDLWIRFFETLGRFCYDASGRIVSLYEGVRQRQISDGALPEKISVVPNGIDVARFAPLRSTRPAKPPLVLALLGRVVPIKDVKTYIRAIRILVSHIPELEGWVVGPDGEDPEYAAECRALAQSLEIADRVRFTGFMNPVELFPQIGLLVLSSISEGLPLVALEGFAAGVPLVSTDVGSCRQLVEGVGEEDQALGVAGGIVPINSPQALAEACRKLIGDQEAWDRASQAGINRVEKLYTQQQMFERYRALYQEALS